MQMYLLNVFDLDHYNEWYDKEFRFLLESSFFSNTNHSIPRCLVGEIHLARYLHRGVAVHRIEIVIRQVEPVQENVNFDR